MLNVLRIPIRRGQVLLLLVDLAILFVSLPVAVLVRQAGGPTNLPPLTLTSVPAILIDFFRYWTGATTIGTAIFVTLFFIFDLYSPERRIRTLRDFGYILMVCSFGVTVASFFYFFVPLYRVGRGHLVIQGAFVASCAFLWRSVYTRVHPRITRPRRVLVIGAGKVAYALLEEIHRSFRSEIQIVGILDDDPAKAQFEMNGYRVVGNTLNLAKAARDLQAEIIVFAIPRHNNPVDGNLMSEILALKTSGVEVYQMPTYFKKITGRVPVEFIEDTWLIFGQGFAPADNGPASRVRRLLDVAIAAICLLALSPLLILISLIIKLTSKGPVLYRQERLGLNRRPYQMIKFRSMVADAERGRGPTWSEGKKDPRVTWIGRFLRRTRLDEVPNFLNVLNGDMSIVGPRPERPSFVDLLEAEIPYYGLRFAVKPGLTGWAQVNYSYGASIEDACKKLQYEVFYIQERSLLLDMLILAKTAQTVLLRPGS